VGASPHAGHRQAREGLNGYHYSMGDTYQRQWWLRCADTIVLATYTCDSEHKNKEDTIIDSILSTLQRK